MSLAAAGAPLNEGASPIRRILACHDGGSASRYVVPWARAIAMPTGVDVTLLWVLAPPLPHALFLSDLVAHTVTEAVDRVHDPRVVRLFRDHTREPEEVET